VLGSLEHSRVPSKLRHSLAGLYRAAKLYVGDHQCYGEQRRAVEGLLSKAGIAGMVVEARLICEMAFGRGDGMPARMHARLGSGTPLAMLLAAAWKRVCALGQRCAVWGSAVLCGAALCCVGQRCAVWGSAVLRMLCGSGWGTMLSCRPARLASSRRTVYCHVLPILLSSGAAPPGLCKRAARLGLWQHGRDQHGAAPGHAAQLRGVAARVAAPDVHDVAQFPVLNARR
jgi:hypothetical protein